MRAGSTYLLPENIYGKVELEPYFKMEYSYATVEFKIGMEQKYVLKKSVTVKNWSFIIIWMHLRNLQNV